MSRYTGYLGKMAACAAALACVGGAAEANTVTFDWVSTSGPAATGSITLTSSLITSPDSFSVPKAQALADITGFSLTFANGEVMSLANATFANSTGWSDDSTGHLTSTWTASQSVTNPAGTLSVQSQPYAGTSTVSTVLTSGITQDFGYWQVATTPVPVPAAAWLLSSGLVGLFAARRRRDSSTGTLVAA